MATAEMEIEVPVASGRPRFELVCGDALASLRARPAASVHCIFTSPPYWSLRAYGTEPQVHGGDPACEHDWADPERAPWANALPGPSPATRNVRATRERSRLSGRACTRCDAWLGELGLEPTPELFVAHLAAVFEEARRVLRADGSLWLNIGDSYSSGGRDSRARRRIYPGSIPDRMPRPGRVPGLKPKDLVGVPWMLAFALRAAGWYLRSELIWHKPNALPEAVQDRPSKAHEHLFLLTKRESYFYDKQAIAEPASAKSRTVGTSPRKGTGVESAGEKLNAWTEGNGGRYHALTRNKRSVWAIALRATKGRHFAAFPPELALPCIRAGTSERGCCPGCGTPWRRITDRVPVEGADRRGASRTRRSFAILTLGWRPGCACYDGRYREEFPRYAAIEARGGPRRKKRLALFKRKYPAPESWPVARALVLDPFSGTGTVGVAAIREGRDYLGIDLKPEFVEDSRARLAAELVALPRRPRRKRPPPGPEQLTLFPEEPGRRTRRAPR